VTTATKVVLRISDVRARTGLARSTIYLFMERGDFPAPVSLGPRAVGWLADEIDAWIAERPRRTRAPGLAV